MLGLPRGGVPVAAEVARALRAPLDVLVVRKLGLPHHPELAMGAIGEGGIRVLDRELVARERVSEPALAAVERVERAELARRTARSAGGSHRYRSRVGRRSSSTTVSPPAAPPAPRSRSRGPAAPGG